MTTPAPLASRALLHSNWPTILLIVGAGIVSAFQVGKAPVALDAIRAALALDLATASWLLSAFAIVGALGGIALGVTVDHIGARRMAIGGLLLQASGSMLGAFAEGAPFLLATRAIEGIGFLVVVIAAPAMIVAVATGRELSRALAAWSTYMPAGIALVMLGAPLLTMLGWRGFWLLNAIVLAVYAALLAFGTRAIAHAASSHRSIAGDIRQTLSAGGPWLLAGLFAAFATAYFAVFGFLPSILSSRLAVGPEAVGFLSAAAVAANIVGNLACGVLLARGVRHAYILLTGFGVMALCGFGILADGASPVAAYTLCVVFSAISGLIPVAIIDGTARHAPRPELVGATVGFAMQGNNVGLALGPATAGALAASFGWSSVPFFVAAVAMAAGVLAVALHKRAAERA